MVKKKTATKLKKSPAGAKARSKTKSTGDAARSKTAATKKPAKKPVASKAASQKVTTKKAVIKKAVTKKATPKKTTPKKPMASKAGQKKAAVKKAPPVKSALKKAAAKKPIPKKAVAKKPVAKKPVAAKTAAPTKAPVKASAKKTTIKKAPKKSASKASGKSAKAGATAKPRKKATPKPKAKDERHTLSDARAAASGLAARAGIKIVRLHANAEPEEKPKTRRLKKSPLSKPQLEKYREILFQKRAEVAGDVNAMESEAFGVGDGGTYPQNQADQGSDEYEQALSLGLAGSQRRLLVEINEALARIESGAYGICTLTGGPIGRDRLDATPWTQLSLEGAREQDRQNYYQ